MTKGIVLAGGSGTRLYPMTAVQSKQLQPVYDKPMIYYPLATLMLAGIRDILIISTPHDTPNIERLLGDGHRWGIRLRYAVQPAPRGIAEAFIIGAEFIGNDQVCLILGDNLFYGKLDFLRRGIATNEGATIFAYRVGDPERYGVVEFAPDGRVLSIEEKPSRPRSHYAIPGVYVFAPDVVEHALRLEPSTRGELEITDLHRVYLERGRLRAEIIGRGVAWLDTGTPESLLEASLFIHAIEKRQGLKIACLEEIALYEGFITLEQFVESVQQLPNCAYRQYCMRIAEEATTLVGERATSN
ncbi:MAG: glucose-1-phosphate thymidylyltransferase RfbA [Chlorobi bacterium]|jgi:glucose-1-phosphate thymidylyltransferase|nr:glucose-1-phosphate thymidylyltransferase RfbA [Chlorobiota bacterium]